MSFSGMINLIILDANPLEDIRNTQRINTDIFNGTIVDRKGVPEEYGGRSHPGETIPDTLSMQ